MFVELVVCWFLFVKLAACWFFSSWNLYIDFFPFEKDFVHRACCVLISVFGTFCKLILVRETCCILTFCFRETCTLIFHLATLNFFMEHFCLLIFVCETCCVLIFLFVKLIYWFCSSWNWIFSWNSLHAGFVHKTFHVLIFVLETCCTVVFPFVKLVCWFFLLVKLILFIELVAYWILFMEPVTCWFCCMLRATSELVACWFFPPWSLYIDFLSSWNWFYSLNVLCVEYWSWNRLRVYFWLWKILHSNFSSWNLYADFILKKLLLFIEFAAWWFCSWHLLRADFCSRNVLYVDLFFFVKLER